MKIFANSQRAGFKRALERVELNEDEPVGVRSLQGMQWAIAEMAKSKLLDFLDTFTSDDALRIVETYSGQASKPGGDSSSVTTPQRASRHGERRPHDDAQTMQNAV